MIQWNIEMQNLLNRSVRIAVNNRARINLLYCERSIRRLFKTKSNHLLTKHSSTLIIKTSNRTIDYRQFSSHQIEYKSNNSFGVLRVRKEQTENSLTGKSFCLEEKFKSTEIIPIDETPSLRIRLNKSDKSDTALQNGKWNLKNVFNLLKTSEGGEGESRENRNSNRFDVLTEFMMKDDTWTCLITIFHPSEASFEASGKRKQDAEENACQNAFQWLKDQGVVNMENKPVALEKQQCKKIIDSKRSILEPLDVKKFDSAQRKYLEDFIDGFELKHKALLENEIDLYLSKETNHQTLHYENTDHIQSFFHDTPEQFNSSKHGLFNLISNRRLKKMDFADRDRINEQLSLFLKRRNESVNSNSIQDDFVQYRDYKRKLENLPIHKHRRELLDLIFDNQVVIIAGDTGSGKSTQMPQYILEDMIQRDCGADCSIIVTQPRRLPTISVSEQTALQFGEQSVGGSFGYQVRFQKKLPIRDSGGVLFCTTGMLLRKMAGNPYLLGISHLILDEVHEREFRADLMFILLKKILEKNDRIKVILMSASMNAEIFSKFFKNCPIFHIAGRCFPVEAIYLDQIETQLEHYQPKPNKSSNDRKVDYDLVISLIHHINNTKQDNDSILCFLPGWNDIEKVSDGIETTESELEENSPNILIIPVHGGLPSEDQLAIFTPLQDGVRKVILSTNITETSLTVPDVVYVIESGLCNEINYNKEYNVSTFGTHLISQANAKQRMGRAGRCRPGICYKLYTRDTEENEMLKYVLPEILRMPLESIVMVCKLYCPDEKVDDFLSTALEPPSQPAVVHAVKTLKLINVLDQDEHLTLLGRKISDLSAHPRLSVCLVTAAMTGCFNQMVNLASMLAEEKDPFVMMPGNRRQVKYMKEDLAGDNLSDYWALSNLLQMHENVNDGLEDNDARKFFDQNRDFINFITLESARNLKGMFTRNLIDNGIEANSDLTSSDAPKTDCLFDLSLLSGLYPNILKCVNEENFRKYQLIEVVTGHRTKYSTESLLSYAPIEYVKYHTSIYFDSFYSEGRRMLMITNASLLPSVYVLFAGKTLKVIKEESSTITFILDDCRYLIYTIDREDLKLILKWKDIWNVYQQWYLCNDKNSSNYVYLKESLKEFLDITSKVQW